MEKVKAAINPQAPFEQLGRRITGRENVVDGGHGWVWATKGAC
jgi:hypothetical protein